MLPRRPSLRPPAARRTRSPRPATAATPDGTSTAAPGANNRPGDPDGRRARTARAWAWRRSPPRPGPARPSSTGTSPTAPSCTPPSARGWPPSLLPQAARGAARGSSQPRQMIAAAIETYLAFLEADPELYRFVVHGQHGPFGPPAGPDQSLSALVGDQAAALTATALEQAGRDPAAAAPWGHGLVGLVRSAADWWLQAERPMLAHRARRPPDRSRLGRTVRRRRSRTPELPGGPVTHPARRGGPRPPPGRPGRPLGPRPPRRPREPRAIPTSSRSTARTCPRPASG